MLKPEVAFYLGGQKPGAYSEVVSQDGLFFVLEVASGMSDEAGHKILEHVKEKIKTAKITTLAEFENFISGVVKDKNLPLGFSIASAYLKGRVLYLKTAGMGMIFIRRKGKMGLLIEGDATASGPVEENDFFIFLTDNFLNLVGSAKGLEKTFDHRSPGQIIDEITPSLKARDDQGAVSLFVNFVYLSDTDNSPSQGLPSGVARHTYLGDAENKIVTDLKSLWITMRTSKKTLTLLTVFILFLILIWSVVLGYRRRSDANAQEKINSTRELVTEKLSSAQDVAYLNMARAQILISESQDAVNKLKTEVGDKRKEVVDLETLVQQAENKILNRQMRQYSEFFDLAVDDKNASGDRFYLDGNIAYILDKKQGVIYQLSLDKKSLSKNQASQIKSADLVAGDSGNSLFFAKDGGVFRIDGQGQLKKVIDTDRDWGEISDMSLFNGNIYLLDRGKDEIWKYPQGGDSYGNKSSYFGSGQAIDLSSISSLAIDGSIYLAGDSIAVKYTSGLRDTFSIDLPDKSAKFNKIVANQDLDKVYLWDKSKSVVYVVAKSGEYVEQINSDILGKASDVLVYKNNVYALNGSKVYVIE
ncbi:hypothetical protein M1328_05670 [Patescibacteria group bacterium]|nr:hypothetical protein [Patescibacteria group bacterium]